MAPLVEGRLADAIPATEFGDGGAGLMFFEGLDDLFFGVSCFHVECCAAFAAHSQLSSGLKSGDGQPLARHIQQLQFILLNIC